jgi:hypothetical protein
VAVLAFHLTQVIDVLIKVLSCPYETRDLREGWMNIFETTFEIFRSYLMGNSRKNKQYFVKYVEFCQSKFIAQVSASSFLLHLAKARMVDFLKNLNYLD